MHSEKLETHGAWLANIAWHTLNGAHARYSQRYGTARRYAARFTPIAAFADPAQPDLGALAQIAAAGETLYLAGVTVPRHAQWDCTPAVQAVQMLRPRPAAAGRLPGTLPTRLQPRDLPALDALVALCRPGPFTPSMTSIGEFFVVREEDRLVACAGTRMTGGGYREISTVCVHPDAAGRGLATQLVQFMAASIEAAGDIPFLHVGATNARAMAVYRRCGFEPLQSIELSAVRKRPRLVVEVAG
jgi:N-acetylglutamate synthase-like GNAT family acetyltransferase